MNSDLETGQSWVDVSVPVYEDMAQWPGNPMVRIRRTKDFTRGENHIVSEIKLSSHTGTHVDAPLHFIRSGQSIDEMPLELAVCKARVISINDADFITVKELEPHGIRQGECILFKTKNSPNAWNQGKFTDKYVSLSEESALYLARKRIGLAGFDYLSAGGMDNGAIIHKALLGNGVWVIEGINLTAIEPGNYDLICLPLKIRGLDGAPARVIVRYLS